MKDSPTGRQWIYLFFLFVRLLFTFVLLLVFGVFYISFYTFVHIFLFQTQKNRPPTSWLKLVLSLSEGRLCAVKYWLVSFCYTRRLQEVSSSINSSSVAEGVKSLTGVFFWTKIKSDVPPHPPLNLTFWHKAFIRAAHRCIFLLHSRTKASWSWFLARWCETQRIWVLPRNAVGHIGFSQTSCPFVIALSLLSGFPWCKNRVPH